MVCILLMWGQCTIIFVGNKNCSTHIFSLLPVSYHSDAYHIWPWIGWYFSSSPLQLVMSSIKELYCLRSSHLFGHNLSANMCSSRYDKEYIQVCLERTTKNCKRIRIFIPVWKEQSLARDLIYSNFYYYYYVLLSFK